MTALRALVVLDELSDSFGTCIDADLRVSIIGSDAVDLLLPVWTTESDVSREDHGALLRRMARSLALDVSALREDSNSHGLLERYETCPTLSAAPFVLFQIVASESKSPTNVTSGLRDGHRLAVFDGDAHDVARRVAILVKRASEVKLQVKSVDRAADRLVVFARYVDDPAQGATYASLVASEAPEGPLAVTMGYPSPAGSVYVSDASRPSEDQVRTIGRVFSGLRRSGMFAVSTEDVVVVQRTDLGWTVYGLHRRFISAEDFLAEMDPRQSIEIASTTLDDSHEALGALRDRLRDPGFSIGYRVRLTRVPHDLSAETDVSALREQVERLESQIAMIEALGARQRRLLRFSDAQLPALVDIIRQVPPSVVARGALKYGAYHDQITGLPNHFVLYDPTDVAVDGFFPEAYWRGRTQDRPMSYWLDPFCADSASKRQTRTLVFTPFGLRLIPALASMASDVDATLRSMFGRMLDPVRDQLDDLEAEPIFIFSSTEGARSGDIVVEIADERSFVPLDASPRWINDYLALRTPRYVEIERLDALAETMYAGPVADEFLDRRVRLVEHVSEEWERAEVVLMGDLDDLVSRLSSELESYVERFQQTYASLDAAKAKLSSIEETIRELERQARYGQSRIADVDKVSRQLEERLPVLDDLLADRVDHASAIVDRARTDVERVSARLDEVNRWARRQRR